MNTLSCGVCGVQTAEAVVCPGPTRFWMPSIFFPTSSLKEYFSSPFTKIYPIRLEKFLTTFFESFTKTFFQFVSKNFCRLYFTRSFTQMFHIFASVFKFHENSLLGCSLSFASCPGNDIFSSFFSHLPTFFTKIGPLDAPQVDARGRRTVRTPPLHATELE